jgi:hypothetical protein
MHGARHSVLIFVSEGESYLVVFSSLTQISKMASSIVPKAQVQLPFYKV